MDEAVKNKSLRTENGRRKRMENLVERKKAAGAVKILVIYIIFLMKRTNSPIRRTVVPNFSTENLGRF